MSSSHRGMVDLSDLHQPRFSSTTVTTATTASTTVTHSRATTGHGILQSFAAEITKPVFRSVSGADCFARVPGISTSEADLWSLLADLLRDKERSSGYVPSAIGLDRVPDTRRWHVSHHSTIQHLLLSTPALRRMVIVLRWLERTYKRSSSLSTSANVWSSTGQHGDKSLLQDRIFSFVRAGQIQRGVDAAVVAKDSDYAAMLMSVQLNTVTEHWYSGTSLVDLFGEYAGGQASEGTWANNSQRLTALATLFEFSKGNEGADAGDSVITAALCGNYEVLQCAFPRLEASWQDVLWCNLRCALILAFNKALKNAGEQIPSSAYADSIDRMLIPNFTGDGSAWVQEAVSWWSKTIQSHLDAYLHRSEPALGLHEELQIRLVQMFLAPQIDDLFLSSPAAMTSDGRTVAFLAICLTSARTEELIGRQFDVRQKTLIDALQLVIRHSINQVGSVAELWSAAEWIVPAATFVRDTTGRTMVYSALLLAARNRGNVLGLGAAFIEEQEVKLIELIRQRDNTSELQETLVRSLKNMISEDSVMLTRDKAAETYLWKCLNAPPSAARAVLADGVELCMMLWRKSNCSAAGVSSAQRLGAISDTVRVMKQHVISRVAAAEQGLQELLHQVSFWEAVCEVASVGEKHLVCCIALKDAKSIEPAATDRIVIFNHQRQEQQLYGMLVVQADRCLALLPAMLPRYSGDAHAAAASAVKQLAESSTMSMCVSKAPGTPSMQLQHVMRHIDLLNQNSAFPKLQVTLARALYDAVNMTSAKCNQVLLKAQVDEALRHSDHSE